MARTLEELVVKCRNDLDEAQARVNEYHSEVQAILDLADASHRDISTDEEDRVLWLFAEIEKSQAKVRVARRTLDEAKAVQKEDREVERRDHDIRDTGVGNVSRQTAEVRVGNEPTTYNQGNDPKGQQFLADVAAGTLMGEPGARERLQRHQMEMDVVYPQIASGPYQQRAVGTTNFSGLVVPQYLTDLVAPAIAARRPTADRASHQVLPPQGMDVRISQVTTASSAALQTEGNPVSETNMDDTLLTVVVRTAAAQQTASRQAVERGVVEPTIVGDLLVRVHTVIDDTILNVADRGLHSIGVDVAYDDATPTGAELYPKLLEAANGVEEALLGLTADTAIMAPRRWNWLAKEMTSTWPLINSSGLPVQAGGTLDSGASYGSGLRGVLPSGMGVVVDASVIKTAGVGAEDEIYILNSSELMLWELPGQPVMIRADEPNLASLQILYVAYSYFAFTAERYANSVQRVNGTGLTTPVY